VLGGEIGMAQVGFRALSMDVYRRDKSNINEVSTAWILLPKP